MLPILAVVAVSTLAGGVGILAIDEKLKSTDQWDKSWDKNIKVGAEELDDLADSVFYGNDITDNEFINRV